MSLLHVLIHLQKSPVSQPNPTSTKPTLHRARAWRHDPRCLTSSPAPGLRILPSCGTSEGSQSLPATCRSSSYQQSRRQQSILLSLVSTALLYHQTIYRRRRAHFRDPKRDPLRLQSPTARPSLIRMSAAVMSNYYSSQLQVHNWMLAQMSSNNYPPPPQADQQHYNALYPTSAGAQQQLLDPAQQDQLQFSNLNQPIYPKVESNGVGHHPHSPSGQHIHDLQHHHVLEEQQRHHIPHAQQQIQQPTPVASHPASNAAQSMPPTQTSTPEQPQKTNRLRKACDSCSIRKVKV